MRRESSLTAEGSFPILEHSIRGKADLYISVSEIPQQGLDVVAARGNAWISRVLDGMDPYPLSDLSVVEASLFLTLEGRDVFASGGYVVEGSGTCDRCAETASVRIEGTFDEVLVPADRAPGGAAHVELRGADLEVGFYDGLGIEAADLLREQVALSLPEKFLCREDCRGLCPVCGINRNAGECSCETAGAPRPFDKLKELNRKKE